MFCGENLKDWKKWKIILILILKEKIFKDSDWIKMTTEWDVCTSVFGMKDAHLGRSNTVVPELLGLNP